MPANEALLTVPNLILSPHLAGLTEQSASRQPGGCKRRARKSSPGKDASRAEAGPRPALPLREIRCCQFPHAMAGDEMIALDRFKGAGQRLPAAIFRKRTALHEAATRRRIDRTRRVAFTR